MQQASRTGSESNRVSNAVAGQTSDAASRMGRLAEQGADRANAAIATAKESGRELAADTTETIREYRSTIEDSVRAQPLMALAVAAFAGLIIGAFWRR